MKYTLSTLMLFFALGAAHAVAADTSFIPLVGVPGLTDIPVTPGGLPDFFNNLYRYLVGLSTVIAVLMIIWGGFQYTTQDSVVKKGDGKKTIQEALFGLVLILSPVLVFSIINPGILNLSLGIPPLKINESVGSFSGGSPAPGSAGTAPSETTAEGCTVTGVANVFQKVRCPTKELSDKWVAKNCLGRSVETVLSKNSSTTITEVICKYQSDGVSLINVGKSGTLYDDYLYRPLADSESTLTKFGNACKSSGGTLCVDQPKSTISISCDSLGGYKTMLPAGISGKCYRTVVYCEDDASAEKARSSFKVNLFSRSNWLGCESDIGFNFEALK